MANFLDLTTGLPALWAKIKSKFYTKAEVDALIPEDEVMIVNITEDNGTYSSNKTYAEMASFIRNGGKTIIAQYRSKKYPLVYLDDNGGESDIYGEIDFGYISFSPHYEETPTEIYENVLFITGFYIDKDNNIEFSWEPIVAAPDSNPLMDGVAAIGTSNQYARADHVHPTDTSRVAVNQGTANAGKVLTVGSNGNVTAAAIPNEVLIVTFTYDRYENNSYIYIADKSNTEITNAYSAGKIVMGKTQDGGGAYFFNGQGFFATQPDEDYPIISYFYYHGSDYEYSGDFVSLIDSNRFYNSVLTKTNTDAYTPTSNYNPATKKYVDDSIPSASTTTPLMDGTASYGSGTSYARANHVHPVDTSRAAVSDVLTKTNTTSYTPTADYHPATKKYVDDAVGAVSTTVSELTDTTISSPSNGQVLTYNSTSGKWENVAVPKEVLYGTVTISGTSATFSSAITGYAITNRNKAVIVRHSATGDIYKLIYFESESGICYFRFNCVTATSIKSISGSGSSSTSSTTALTGTYSIQPILDTNISSPSAGQALIYDSTNSKWVNGSVASDVASLTDTTISSPTNGQMLQYDATSSKWVNATLPTGVTETRVNELIAAALAQYGDGDTATYGYNDASEVNY